MNVPSEQMIAAIVAVTAFCGYIVRFFLLLYKEHVSKQTETMIRLLEEGRAHDKVSAEAHGDQCRVLREITTTLKSINGKSSKNGGTK